MCGIAAVINGTRQEVELMGHAIRRRGRDSTITEMGRLKVFFTHLPTTDLDAPPQPYRGNYTVWLNGFISNWKELAEKYNIAMETHCDTELVGKYFDKFGFRTDEFNGVFAILAYHRWNNTIEMQTDRYGARQLYEYEKGNTKYICSEVKGITAVNDIGFNEDAIDDWKYSLGVMTDDTIYRGIKRVPTQSWTLPQRNDTINYTEAREEVKRLFLQAIERNKVGCLRDCVFLSGGIDSGLIAKYIKPDYCFSMDYKDGQYSEGENIRLNSTGIHYAMICNEELKNKYAAQTLKALDDLKAGSCYTNFALTEFASRFATVIYSGAGGDEFFGGYPHRLGRPLNYVIRRTEQELKEYNITHFEYDLKFLRAVLVVEDRMAGWFTVETRYPLLDNDLIDYVLTLPKEYLQDKMILKDISGLHPQVLNSPKRGFSNPYFSNKEWVEFCLTKINNNVRHGHLRNV